MKNPQSEMAPRVVRAYELQESEDTRAHIDDALLPLPPFVILEFDRFVLAFTPELPDEVEYFTSLHALQVAHSIDGGTFDSMYNEDEECADYWREVEQSAEIWEMIEGAVNCTPGQEGQTIEVGCG